MLQKLKDWGLLFLAAIVYLAGLQLDVMDVDSAQYASISREMAESGHYLHVFQRGSDYLDKPPLLFWAAATSFKLFGVHNWSFKLIPFIFAVISLLATYRIGRILYDAKTGRIASMILGTCQAYFLFTLDLRTDTLLTACSTIAIWQIMEFLYGEKRRFNLISGFVFIGLAMVAKGPLGLMVPMLALGSHFLINRYWQDIFRKEWIGGLFITSLVLAPMVWGLYTQFDLHPEKAVMMPGPDGKQPRSDISGVHFYFWEQSFGRITGDNVWKDGSGPFFFVHTFLWAFMPWALLAIAAFFWKLHREIKSLLHSSKAEFLTLGGFLIPFLVLSTSQFKLPHYIFPLFPFAALFTAQMLREVLEGDKLWSKRGIYFASLLTLLAVFLLSLVLLFYVFPMSGPATYIFPLLAVFSLVLLLRESSLKAIVRSLSLGAIAVNLVMNTHFYPLLLNYQMGSQMADKALALGARPDNTAFLNSFSFSFDFYMKAAIPIIGAATELGNEIRFVVTDAEGLNELKKSGREIVEKEELMTYPITNLSVDFLSPETRPKALKAAYLVELGPPSK